MIRAYMQLCLLYALTVQCTQLCSLDHYVFSRVRRSDRLTVTPYEQEAQLSPRDRATLYVSYNLVNYCTAVREITFDKACTK